MTISHILAVLVTMALYGALAIVFIGWSNFLVPVLGLQKNSCPSLTLQIWMGWAFSLFLLQLCHFFVPINAGPTIAIALVGAGMFAYRSIIGKTAEREHPLKNTRFAYWSVALIALFAFWVASRSMLTPTCYDSGLYHLHKIKWINSFPVVPGLGNLDSRLAFNVSFFTYVAALNLHPFFGHGASVANSFLLLLAMATCVDLLRPILATPSTIMHSSPFRYTSVALLFPYLVYLALSSNGLASPTPNLTATLIQLAIAAVFLQSIGAWLDGNTNLDSEAAFLGVMATTSVTIKMSNLAFAIVIFGFVVLYAWHARGLQMLLRIAILSSIISLVWCAHSIILSGYPLFPSTIGMLPFDWTVPAERAIDISNWVYSWARRPHMHWSKVLGNMDWFPHWVIATVSKRRNYVELLFPMGLVALLLPTTILMRFLVRRGRPRTLEWSTLIPPAIGLIYWFVIAPAVAFGHALFTLSATTAIVLFLSVLRHIVSQRVFLLATCAALLAMSAPLAAYIALNRGVLCDISTTGWHAPPKATLVPYHTKSGLTIYTPTKGDQCWVPPLPSTAYPQPAIRLRTPGKLSAGFTIKEEGTQQER